jgi:hypothetical protein
MRESGYEPGYPHALRVLREAVGGDLQKVLNAACAPIPAWDPVVYLADFSGNMLFSLATGVASEDVAGSMAGRAFTTGQPVTAERDGAVRLWVPVTEQASMTGVLAVTISHGIGAIVEQVELLGVFAGLAVAAAARVSDTPYIRRQSRKMSLPAGMQWDLLPPLNARIPGATIAGLLEPAYHIAGDAFDYAVSDSHLDFAILDGMGHGIASTLLTGLAVGAYRHARRDGASITDIHTTIDQALADHFGDDSFATGIIGKLALDTGRLEWSCAGHMPPLLLRGRKVVAELTNEPIVPFGLRGGPPRLCTFDLEPDDAVLLYTDGVTEAHLSNGELFGLPRLIDLIEREAGSNAQPEEVLRRLVAALLDHQPDGLRDDATFLLVQWTGRLPPCLLLRCLLLPCLREHRVHRLHDGDGLIERHQRALHVAGREPARDLVGLVAQAPALVHRLDTGRVCAVPGDERHRGGSVEVAFDLDPRVGTDDRRPRRALGPQGARQHGLSAAVVAEQHGRLRVHAGERRVAHGPNPAWRAEDHRRERHRVDAEVKQRPAAKLRCEQPEIGIFGEPLAVIRGHGDDVAEYAPRQPVPDHGDMRQEPGPHRLHGEEPVLPRHTGDLAGLRRVHRERLLDQHVLARQQREDRVVVVHRVRRRDVDHVDVRIGHKLLVAAVPARDAELIREAVRRFQAARPDRDGDAGIGQPQVGHERLRDPARSENSPSQRAIRHVFVPSPAHVGSQLSIVSLLNADRAVSGHCRPGAGPVRSG